MSRARVLVVEDDAAIRRGIADALRASGYDVIEAGDGDAGTEAAIAGGDLAPDLILLDVLMPRADGFAVLRSVRAVRPALPVIMLTARGTEEDRVRGLRGGADDYVVKPFGLTELLARVEAVLRRSPERPSGLPTVRVAGRVVDFDRREAVLTDGSRAAMSQTECNLVRYLADHRGKAVSRDELLLRVWGLDPTGVRTRTVDMAVARVREALGDDADEPRVVITVRGVGYMLGPDGDVA